MTGTEQDFSRHENYAEGLKEAAVDNGILSVGYDPRPEDWGPWYDAEGYDPRLPSPEEMNPENFDNQDEYHVASGELIALLTEYFDDATMEIENQGLDVGAWKPNYDFFDMWGGYDKPGMLALGQITRRMRDANPEAPIIMDTKKADIDPSSRARSEASLGLPNVDATTVPPWMGSDSVGPFLERAHQTGQGVYLLPRTTNDGAADLQELELADGSRVYEAATEKVVDWAEEFPGTVGAVMPGNEIPQLKNIAGRFAEADAEIPTLIPGVGAQGGEAGEVGDALREVGYDPRLARVNASSGTMYAWAKDMVDEELQDIDLHAEATAAAVEEFNEALEDLLE